MFFMVFIFVSIVCGIADVNSLDFISTYSDFRTATSYLACEFEPPLPFTIPLKPITEQDVSFVIYSRQHRIPITVNTYDDSKSVKNSPINFEKPVVLYVQGTKASYKISVPLVAEPLLPKEDINVIFVDWDSYAFYQHKYTLEVTLPRLGDILAKFFGQLISAGANPKQIYGIGPSSGAHPIGVASRKLNSKIGKIMGIDPVGSCYNFGHESKKLQPTDADFVQIIHCSTGEAESGKNLGDATFYVNGGVVQPECSIEEIFSISGICSHLTCIAKVFQTLNFPNKYLGFKCDTIDECLNGEGNKDDTAVMGYYASTKALGKYYVDTKIFS